MRYFFIVVIFLAQSVFADNSQIMPPEIKSAALPVMKPMQKRIYHAAQNHARYLLTQVHPWEDDPRLLLITKSWSNEHGIRPNAGMIEGLAILYRFGPYDEDIVGMSRDDLLERIIVPMMRYCTSTHITGDWPTSDGKKWGDAWQSALWARRIGDAAWYLWDDLPEDLRTSVRRLVAREADRIAAKEPPHQVEFDTKSEENGWNSQILSVAVVLMPDDPRRVVWEKAFQKWAFSAHLRQADKDSHEIVDGQTVAEQFTGANLHNDYTLENHGFVHPDYMSAFSLVLSNILHYDMTGRTPPQAVFYNVNPVYTNLKWFALPDGSYVYPNGQDWELFRNPLFVYGHFLMAAYSNDSDSWQFATRSLDALEKMQHRYPSGMIYGKTECFFPSARTDLFCYLCRSWLVLNQTKKIHDDFQTLHGVRYFDSAKIILHRSEKNVNTFSWGKKVMAMCIPLQLDRLVSPDQRNGIGHICVKGKNKGKPLPVTLEKVHVETDKNSFVADATLSHGKDLVRTELRFSSDPQGTLTISEKLVALGNITTTEIATGLIGILNNTDWVYERGQRCIKIDGHENVVPALSGKIISVDSARQIKIDSAMQIQSDQPIRPCYRGANAVERGRATDLLYLNYSSNKKQWHTGEIISEYRVKIHCK